MGKMKRSLINVEPLNLKDELFQPVLVDTGYAFSDNTDYVNKHFNIKEKLDYLGVKPGMRFFIIRADNHSIYEQSAQVRNNWEAIWSEKQLKNEHCSQKVCQNCEFLNTRNWGWEHCSDCGDGLNITGSFFITEKYLAAFGDPEENSISGR